MVGSGDPKLNQRIRHVKPWVRYLPLPPHSNVDPANPDGSAVNNNACHPTSSTPTAERADISSTHCNVEATDAYAVERINFRRSSGAAPEPTNRANNALSDSTGSNPSWKSITSAHSRRNNRARAPPGTRNTSVSAHRRQSLMPRYIDLNHPVLDKTFSSTWLYGHRVTHRQERTLLWHRRS